MVSRASAVLVPTSISALTSVVAVSPIAVASRSATVALISIPILAPRALTVPGLLPSRKWWGLRSRLPGTGRLPRWSISRWTFGLSLPLVSTPRPIATVWGATSLPTGVPRASPPRIALTGLGLIVAYSWPWTATSLHCGSSGWNWRGCTARLAGILPFAVELVYELHVGMTGSGSAIRSCPPADSLAALS